MLYITLPKKLQKSKQVVVYKWLTNSGEKIEKDQPICLVHISQDLFEIKSDISGFILKEMVPAGGVFDGTEPIAVIGEKGEDVSKLASYGDSRTEFAAENKAQSEKAGNSKAGKNSDNSAKNAEKSKSDAEKETNSGTNNQSGVEKMSSENSTPVEGDIIPILMPQAGQSMEEGTIVAWKVAEGDRIEVGQVIMEIETDKAVMEVEAVDAGRIAKIISKEGDIVEVKVPVAYLAEEGVDLSSIGGSADSGQAAAGSSSATNAPAATPNGTAAAAMPEGVVPVLMPQAGQSMEEGTIVAWKVAEGDQIEVGQVLMEIETDKAVMEVEAVDAGRIAKIISKEGDIVEVKEPVAYLADAGVDIDGYLTAVDSGSTASEPSSADAGRANNAQQRSTEANKQSTAPAQRSETGRLKASPAARKAAKSAGINLESIKTGSGPGGRILSSDVANSNIISTTEQVIPLTKMRRAIAKNLQYSKQTVPHFYLKGTIDAAKLFDTYKATKQEFKCSVNDFVTMACAKAIRQYPAFRSQYSDDGIIEKPSVNIGIAVGTDDGLTVPVVCDIDRMTLDRLATRTREVVESARNGKMEGVGQGVFTITNLGMFGTEEFSAIINPPEAAILAVGAIREDIVVRNGAIVPTRVMTMTLSVDHRVVDGVLAAQFMTTVKELLEAPEQLL